MVIALETVWKWKYEKHFKKQTERNCFNNFYSISLINFLNSCIVKVVFSYLQYFSMESKFKTVITDSVTSTEDLCAAPKLPQENILLTIIKELCSENGKLSAKVKGKVSRIMADCDLTHYSSLHKMNTSDESTTTLLGKLWYETIFHYIKQQTLSLLLVFV